MKEHKINKLNNFINGWYIDKKICTDLITFFNEQKEHHYKGIVAGGYLPKLKKSTDLNFNIKINTSPVKNYLQMLTNCLKKYKEKHKVLDEKLALWDIVENVNIQKYKKKEGYFSWHTERINSVVSKRLLVFMTYLNDVTDGGETEWFYQKTKVKAEKGLTVIWPAEWTHLHRGCVSKTQEKYIITGWYSLV